MSRMEEDESTSNRLAWELHQAIEELIQVNTNNHHDAQSTFHQRRRTLRHLDRLLTSMLVQHVAVLKTNIPPFMLQDLRTLILLDCGSSSSWLYRSNEDSRSSIESKERLESIVVAAGGLWMQLGASLSPEDLYKLLQQSVFGSTTTYHTAASASSCWRTKVPSGCFFCWIRLINWTLEQQSSRVDMFQAISSDTSFWCQLLERQLVLQRQQALSSGSTPDRWDPSVIDTDQHQAMIQYRTLTVHILEYIIVAIDRPPCGHELTRSQAVSQFCQELVEYAMDALDGASSSLALDDHVAATDIIHNVLQHVQLAIRVGRVCFDANLLTTLWEVLSEAFLGCTILKTDRQLGLAYSRSLLDVTLVCLTANNGCERLPGDYDAGSTTNNCNTSPPARQQLSQTQADLMNLTVLRLIEYPEVWETSFFEKLSSLIPNNTELRHILQVATLHLWKRPNAPDALLLAQQFLLILSQQQQQPIGSPNQSDDSWDKRFAQRISALGR